MRFENEKNTIPTQSQPAGHQQETKCEIENDTKEDQFTTLLHNQARGGSRPKLKGGQLGVGAPKIQSKVSAPKARENFWSLIQENSLVFLLNGALVYMFPRIQNETLKKERVWVRLRGAFLAKKGAPNLNFHREGGAVAPICPP